MRLEDYWGIGPKTRDLLDDRLGTERAIEAIEAGEIRALVEAGVSRGRATRILRHVLGGDGMDVLATPDTRDVYKELLDAAGGYAVTADAGDRIRLLTPFVSADRAIERLDAVSEARESWAALDGETRKAALSAFERYDESGGGERAAVETALALHDAGVQDGTFASIADLDDDALSDAATALAKLDDGAVREGADDELDRLRETLDAVGTLADGGLDVLERIREEGVHGSADFREVFVDFVATETPVPPGRVREASPDDAADAADFVSSAFRTLVADLEESVEERAETVAAALEADIADARADVDTAVSAVADIAFVLSLARFAEAHDLVRPAFVSARRGFAVREARNLGLAAGGDSVQPVTYGIGDHSISGHVSPPSGQQVSVLTGANSGGKTTLLETLCGIALLAQMGLPVPAAEAQVVVYDAIVFHRRHASFNAGVLESTLRSIVPPLTRSGRTLMLVDEFEAITEPGSAANLLHGLVSLTVERDALGVFVTHLADDLSPLPDEARIDGIFAEGLTQDLELRVDYQPRFGTVGKSTPEFIVSRLVAGASDRRERAGFEVLARAVGEENVQRTLADARWISPD